LGVGYSDFLLWCCSGDLGTFSHDYCWPNWQAEVRDPGGDQAFGIYPPPCTSGLPYGERYRGVVPLAELYRLYVGDGG
jgi:hypothetical protein